MVKVLIRKEFQWLITIRPYLWWKSQPQSYWSKLCISRKHVVALHFVPRSGISQQLSSKPSLKLLFFRKVPTLHSSSTGEQSCLRSEILAHLYWTRRNSPVTGLMTSTLDGIGALPFTAICTLQSTSTCPGHLFEIAACSAFTNCH